MKEKKRILFLEDEPTIREVLTEYMELSGYEVTGMDRGDATIHLLGRETFDLAVLDICPGQTVLQFLHISGSTARAWPR